MSLGDAMHPPESWDPEMQVAILAEGAGTWYTAHLLIFLGAILFVPGVLGLTGIGARRRPTTSYVARVLMLVSMGGMASVFAFEMLLGSFLSHGAEPGAAVTLLRAFQGPAVFGPLAPSLLSFFVGTGFLVASLAPWPTAVRWPTLVFALGAALILAEIVLAQVLLSQIGNVLLLAAGVGFARVLLRPSVPVAPGSEVAVG